MVKLRCQGCGRIVTMTKEKYETHSQWDCAECKGRDSLQIFGSDEDNYEDQEKEYDEDETYTCDECDEDYSEEDIISFEDADVTICKKCIDRAYPKQSETKIEYIEKIVEKPIIRYLNQEGQEVKKQESTAILNNIF
jgi:transposase-like protein